MCFLPSARMGSEAPDFLAPRMGSEVPDFPAQIYAGRSGQSMPQTLCSDAFSKLNLLDPKLIVQLGAAGIIRARNRKWKGLLGDVWVEQLVASAQAAIDEGVRLGVVDRHRVAVMGHSYGAFMTVNLLAHFRESSSRLHDAPTRLPQRLHYRSRQCARHGCHSGREDQHGSRSAWRCRGPLLGADCRALRVEPHGRERGRRPDLSFYDCRLGRPDPHGPILTLCDAEVNRPQGSLRDCFRLRSRPRPARDRHPKRGIAAAQSLPCRRYLLPLPTPAEMAQGSGDRQNGGEQPDDRSRHREAWPEALRGAGGLQVVRGWLARRFAGLRWRRERGRVVRPFGWQCVDDGQRWSCPSFAGGGDHSADGPRSRRIYRELTREFGEPVYDRVEAPATPEQKEILEKLSPEQVRSTDLAGEKVQAILTRAPGNGASIGGLKVIAESGWFAARPSGTENIYKIYAESFRGADHLRRILEEAQTIVSDALAAPHPKEKS